MDETVKTKDADTAKQRDADLDEGLDETFPASDAPAVTQPGGGTEDKMPEAEQRR